VELAGEGADTIEAWIDLVLPSNVEIARLQGSATLSATGNADANYLYGNAAANRLDGGAGADEMFGGAGDDVYVFDNASDSASEIFDAGSDTVESGVTVALGQNIENILLTGSAAINGSGNELDNVLRGNAGANVLTGGSGNDTYFIAAGDSVVESSGGGSDTIVSEVSITLPTQVENLRLADVATALNATGNLLANQLWGNRFDNTLNGGTGADRMEGGQGNDVYIVDNVADVVVELQGQGIDTVQSSVTYRLTAEVENLTLTGSGAISATGNQLDNFLTGNSGANVLTGGAGNDTYVVTSRDTVVESAGEGLDTVQSAGNWTLAAHVENLMLTGTGKISGTGNELDNRLVGNSAANVLKGGKGNDTYVVGAGDTVTENLNEGIDTIESAIAWTLGSNLENLTLTGTSAVNGNGNTLANRLRGNSANNVLTGGTGNDTYLFGRGGAADTIVDSDSTGGNADLLLFDADVASDQLWFRRSGTALEISIIGTADKVTVSNWYGGASNHLERIQVADGHYLLDSKVDQLVQAMAAMAPPPMGQTDFSAAQHQQLEAVLAASWQSA
jgi:Ca2+-binding RTX toxin-like protein